MNRSFPILVVVLCAGCSGEQPPTSTDVPRFDGAAFQIELTRSTLVEPTGAAAQDLMDLLLDDLTMVVQFSGDSANPSALSAVGTSEGGTFTQDPCSRTVSFDGALTWADPDIGISAADWTFEAYDLSVPIRELEMSATLSDDGTSLGDFDLSAYMDSQDFDVAAGDLPPCELVGSLGVDCVPCDDEPGRVECLSVVLTEGVAARVALAADLVPITAADVAANAECEATSR